jgi:hypothetical protein
MRSKIRMPLGPLQLDQTQFRCRNYLRRPPSASLIGIDRQACAGIEDQTAVVLALTVEIEHLVN